MYLPKHFHETDHTSICEFLEAFPLAQLISIDENQNPYLNPLPLLIENQRVSNFTFIGHMSRANKQWKHFETKPHIHGSFLGPSAYISPLWYGESHASHVPTWSYLFVAFEGNVEIVSDKTELIALLKNMSDRFEAKNQTNWEFSIPSDLQGEALSKAIVGFRIGVKKMEAKFKISQNRTQQEQQSVVKELEHTQWQALSLADMMKKLLK